MVNCQLKIEKWAIDVNSTLRSYMWTQYPYEKGSKRKTTTLRKTTVLWIC
jgi:hypothetical protein